MNLADYLKAERGRNKKLAVALAVKPPFVSQLRLSKRPAPVERCAAIEHATGGAVRRWDLRPTDWHLIWPDLVSDPAAPAVVPASAEPAA